MDGRRRPTCWGGAGLPRAFIASFPGTGQRGDAGPCEDRDVLSRPDRVPRRQRAQQRAQERGPARAAATCTAAVPPGGVGRPTLRRPALDDRGDLGRPARHPHRGVHHRAGVRPVVLRGARGGRDHGRPGPHRRRGPPGPGDPTSPCRRGPRARDPAHRPDRLARPLGTDPGAPRRRARCPARGSARAAGHLGVRRHRGVALGTRGAPRDPAARDPLEPDGARRTRGRRRERSATAIALHYVRPDDTTAVATFFVRSAPGRSACSAVVRASSGSSPTWPASASSPERPDTGTGTGEEPALPARRPVRTRRRPSVSASTAPVRPRAGRRRTTACGTCRPCRCAGRCAPRRSHAAPGSAPRGAGPRRES